jgi:hypothetical protein
MEIVDTFGDDFAFEVLPGTTSYAVAGVNRRRPIQGLRRALTETTAATREEPKVCGLAAGGSWIRNIGSSRHSTGRDRDLPSSRYRRSALEKWRSLANVQMYETMPLDDRMRVRVEITGVRPN